MSAADGGLARAALQPATWPAAARWAALVAVSALLSLTCGAAGLPAGLLLGPMIGGIVFGVNGLHLAVPRWSYLGAQGLIGAMVAGTITPSILVTLSHDAPLFCFVMLSTVAGCTAIGWLISRIGLIPGATAIFGTSPGAASAMVVLAEAEEADAGTVAFMQYSRALLVALAAALVARYWVGAAGVHMPGAPWLAPVHWGDLAEVLLLAAAGAQIARWLRLQAWALLGPLLLLAILHGPGWVTIDLPRWLLAAAYAMVGWHVGLGFRRESLLRVGKALPVVLGAAVCLIGLCGLLAVCLAELAHVDALTAYLATSPGGMDSVAIIAASAGGRVDLPFVLALQAVRLLFVIGLMPLVTRRVVRHSPHLQAARKAR